MIPDLILAPAENALDSLCTSCAQMSRRALARPSQPQAGWSRVDARVDLLMIRRMRRELLCMRQDLHERLDFIIVAYLKHVAPKCTRYQCLIVIVVSWAVASILNTRWSSVRRSERGNIRSQHPLPQEQVSKLSGLSRQGQASTLSRPAPREHKLTQPCSHWTKDRQKSAYCASGSSPH